MAATRSPVRSFQGKDGALVRKLEQTLLQIQRMDARRAARALEVGAVPVTLKSLNAVNVTAAIDTLLARATEARTHKS